MQPLVLTRRALLGIVATTLVACSKKRGSTTPTPSQTPVAPDQSALTAARRGEDQLVAWYDAAIRRASVHDRPGLQVERAIHVTHRSALHSVPDAGGHLPVIANMRGWLRMSAAQLRHAALAAIDGNNAALLASIAASHEASLQ